MRGLFLVCILFMGLGVWAQEEEEAPRAPLKPSPRKIDEAAEQAKTEEEFAIFGEDKFANGALANKPTTSSGPAAKASVGRGPASAPRDEFSLFAPKQDHNADPTAVKVKAPIAPGLTATGTAPAGPTVQTQQGLQPGPVQPGKALPGGVTRPGYTPTGTSVAAPVMPTQAGCIPGVPCVQPGAAQPKDNSAMMQALTSALGSMKPGSGGNGNKNDAGKGGASPSGSTGPQQNRGQQRAQQRDQDSDGQQCRSGRTRDGGGQWQAASSREMTPGEGGAFNFPSSGDVFSPVSGQMTVTRTGSSCRIEIKTNSCPAPGTGGPRRSGQQGERTQPPRQPADQQRKCTITMSPKNAEACLRLRSGPVTGCTRLFGGAGTMKLKEEGQATPSDNLMGTYLGQTAPNTVAGPSRARN